MPSSSSPRQQMLGIPDEKCYCDVELRSDDPRWTRSYGGRSLDCSSDKRKKGNLVVCLFVSLGERLLLQL